uniref:Uncharacterized protein n=1 Tax=Ditylum brightwellii TaxID=49249 RepID=A0A7S4S476_9STRA
MGKRAAVKPSHTKRQNTSKIDMEMNNTNKRHTKNRPCIGDDITNEQMRRKRARSNYDIRSSSLIEDAHRIILSHGSTLLHRACEKKAPLKVLSWLLKECPEDAKEKDSLGKTPFHCACEKSATLEFVSLLLKAYPEAAKMKDNDGMTPLHYECENGASTDIVLLLLNAFPEAVAEKDDEGRTPLHCLCLKRSLVEKEQHAMVENVPEVAYEADHLQSASSNIPSIKVISLLLERYPLAVTEEDCNGNTPIDFWNEHHSPDYDERLATILFGIENLYEDDLDQSIAYRILEEFQEIGWWAGVALALDLCPSIAQSLGDIPTSAIPSFLSMLGRRCDKLTMWNVLINRQDILNIN